VADGLWMSQIARNLTNAEQGILLGKRLSLEFPANAGRARVLPASAELWRRSRNSRHAQLRRQIRIEPTTRVLLDCEKTNCLWDADSAQSRK
jgi:hypothetical protein